MLLRGWPAAALLLVLTLAAYGPAMRAGFIWDDIDIYIVENPLVHAADGLYRFWFTRQPVDYYPLTNTLFWIEWRLWGDHATGYHVLNILLHALASLLVWRILVRLRVPAAWVAAALYAVHPVNVESVAWVSQQKNTLSACFFFAAFLCWLRFDAQGGRRWYAGSLLLFLLSLLSKTASVTLPLVLLGHAWWRRGRLTPRDFRRLLPFLGLVAILGPVTLWFQNRALGAVPTEDVAMRLAAAGWAVWFYLYKAILPVDLLLAYPYWRVDTSSILSYLPGLAFLACLALAWRFRRTAGRPVLAGLGYFTVSLLPVLGLLGVGPRYTRVADHWQYTAIVGVIALLVGLVGLAISAPPEAAPQGPGRQGRGRPRPQPDAAGRRGAMPRLGAVAALGLIALFAALTWHRAGIYKDGESAWRSTLAQAPNSSIAHNGLGKVLVAQGHLEEARVHFEEAVRLNPGDSQAHQNLGNILDEQGDVDEAARHYLEARRLTPQDADLHFNLATLLAKQGKAAAAAEEYAASLRLRPADAEAHRDFADLLAGMGKAEEAVAHYRETLRLRPADLTAANRLAWILATSSDQRLQNGREAVQLATQVCQATGYREPSALDALAAAYARTGRLRDAVTTARLAVGCAGEAHRPDQAREIEARLHAYEAALGLPRATEAGR